MKSNKRKTKSNKQEYQKTLYEVQNLICEHFNEMIISRKLSYYEVSKISNVSISTVYNIKDGRCLPSLYTLLAILTALKEPIGHFFKECFKNVSPNAAQPILSFREHALLDNLDDLSMVSETSPESLFLTVTDSKGAQKNISFQELIENYYPPKKP